MVTDLQVMQQPTDQVHNMSPEAMLATIQAWPHWEEIGAVAYKEYHLPKERFEEALPEYQKFLCLAVFHEGLGMYSSTIDQLWHAHILSTVLYADLCASVIGKFVHHVPNIEQSTEEKCATCQSCRNCSQKCRFCSSGGDKGSKDAFIEAYQAAFGPLPALWELNQADTMTR